MSRDLRTINSYWSVEEAHLARVQLDAAGVRAFVADATTLGMAWHLGNALEGAKLQVAEDDVDEAIEILKQDENWRADDADLLENDSGDAIDSDQREDASPDHSGTLNNVDSIRKPVILLAILIRIVGG